MERAILVGCSDLRSDGQQFHYAMEELKNLAKTAEAEVAAVVTQSRPKPDPATYIGRGKAEEIAALCKETEAETVIFNGELSPTQQANLAELLNVKVIDRTQLILDIFAKRARSREGRLQVELAQLEYLLPRLSGMGESLSRLGGGIGTRGPGETQLETDRRHIRRRIGEIKKQLADVVRHRGLYRARRKKSDWFRIALVGYTNAGKSTLFNRLTSADAYEEDLLFATLDPLTRRFRTPSGFTTLMTDTVGFIQQLPTGLIAAFRSTLEEVKEADLLVHVVDLSHPNRNQHIRTVDELLGDLGAGAIPKLMIFNKRDLCSDPYGAVEGDRAVSALDEADIDRIKRMIEDAIVAECRPYRTVVPAAEGGLMARLETGTIVASKTWQDEEQAFLYSGYVWPASPLYIQLRGKGDPAGNV
ncbi:GTPase HflX [Caenibacillus caldisaponilyticus]|uniref:GTPase HflX n=1 Tax=Caenibacillus caldisaponilyticus TaxID=1674942 RepID=UPI0009884566|nr:GTPase HflX [Caenibacillus caldisaponilyticus]